MNNFITIVCISCDKKYLAFSYHFVYIVVSRMLRFIFFNLHFSSSFIFKLTIDKVLRLRNLNAVQWYMKNMIHYIISLCTSNDLNKNINGADEHIKFTLNSIKNLGYSKFSAI